ncbi:MAG: hypothetical protein LBQ68_07995, partial [Clostridiales bacterium]|nr:hypothetical protein [Clostridiales bacterium]
MQANRWIISSRNIAKRHLRLRKRLKKMNSHASMNTLEKSAQRDAVRFVLDAYDHYNKLTLTHKLKAYIAAQRILEQTQAQLGALDSEKTQLDEAEHTHRMMLENYSTEYSECDTALNDLWTRRDADSESGALLNRLLLDVNACEAEREQKATALDSKQKQQSVLETRINTRDLNINMFRVKIEERMKRLAELSIDAGFSEHRLLKSEESANERVDSFDSLQMIEVLKRHSEALQNGLMTLDNLAHLEPEYEKCKEELSAIDNLLYKLNVQVAETEILVKDRKAELIHALEKWSEENKYLFIHPGIMEKIQLAVMNENCNDEPLNLFAFEDDVLSALTGAIHQKIGVAKNKLNILNEEKAARQTQIRLLRQNREIEPVLSLESKQNRRFLTELNIPFTPFYKYLRFKSDID